VFNANYSKAEYIYNSDTVETTVTEQFTTMILPIEAPAVFSAKTLRA